MDERTARYYRERANETFDRFDGAPSRVAAHYGIFPPRSRVLDIGAGSGKDVRLLLAAGYDAYGIEPSDELRRLAIDRYPELSGRLFAGTLPDLSNPFDGTFDGILCSAVLMHLTPAELDVASRAIRKLLQPGASCCFRFRDCALIFPPNTAIPMIASTNRTPALIFAKRLNRQGFAA